MKALVTALSIEELKRQFPISGKFDGWCFRVEEVSAGVFEVSGSDVFRRRVSHHGADPDALLESCIQDARGLSKNQPIQRATDNDGAAPRHV